MWPPGPASVRATMRAPGNRNEPALSERRESSRIWDVARSAVAADYGFSKRASLSPQACRRIRRESSPGAPDPRRAKRDEIEIPFALRLLDVHPHMGEEAIRV